MHFVRNRRAKYLAIRINAEGRVRVTVPGSLSQRRAAQFVETKKGWILDKLNGLERPGSVEEVIRPGDTIQVGMREIPVILKGRDDTVELAIWRILAAEAKRMLPRRVAELAAGHDLHYTGLKLRRMKSRWGSCSARNSINLNTWLVMLPEELRDYVILHELVHTLHKHHGPEFWACLDAHTNGRSKALRKALRAKQIMQF